MLNQTLNDPKLADKTAEAIVKIQALGYTFAYDIKTEMYQACLQNPDGSLEVIHEFADWEAIIAFTEEHNLS
ncbi:hypothetical protein F4Z99_09475 [Candidatus Poribacteria bacterium]|nr:hypothetical protein [Candidatus Poribacteria bacterium]MYB01459.1 hypothetical protein [Candidatus Poribacteria bacterium]